MEVICKCGYRGDEMVQFETEIPSKALVRWSGSSYFNHVEWLRKSSKTLNWACPKCGKILVRQLGGMSYNGEEQEAMCRRLWHNSALNDIYLRAEKLPPGTYSGRIINVRKLPRKNARRITIELDNPVVVKESKDNG